MEKQQWYHWIEHAVLLAGAVYAGNKLYNEGAKGIKAKLTKMTIDAAKMVPGGDAIVKQQQQEALDAIEGFILGKFPDEDKHYQLPEHGSSIDDIMRTLKDWRDKESDFRSGKAFGGIYHDGEQHEDMIRDALSLYADSNALYPAIFPGLRKFEAEVISMTVKMLNGGDEGVGCVTSGGTESIMMAVKVYRDRGKDLFGIDDPVMLIPASAHAAFMKGAHYFSVEPVLIPVESEENQRLDVAKVQEALEQYGNRVVMVICSAPTFPHGCIDPIEQVAALIAPYPQIGFHIDSCLGAFCLPWLTELGYLKKKFDFSVPQVTSMSADVHKYGYGPKGVSVICWRNRDYRKYQYFTYCDWSGGLYCSPSLQGSRAGGPIAAAWATLMHLGRDGYIECVQAMHTTFLTLRDGINSIEGLRVMSDPDACSIAWVSTDDRVDIFKVADAMGESDWSVNRLQLPRCIQVQVGYRKQFDADAFLKCLRESVDRVRADPGSFKDGMAGIYGMAADLADADATETISDILHSYMDVLLRV